MELDTATDPDERVTRGVTVAPITLSASISIQPCRRRDAYGSVSFRAFTLVTRQAVELGQAVSRMPSAIAVRRM
jgi:hypothetical protein